MACTGEGREERRREGNATTPLPVTAGGSSHLGPVEGDPLRGAGLVVARLLLNGALGQAVDVLQRLLLSRADLPDAQNCPCSDSTITRLSAL